MPKASGISATGVNFRSSFSSSEVGGRGSKLGSGGAFEMVVVVVVFWEVVLVLSAGRGSVDVLSAIVEV
jgi:hypothetical protein